jgi:hypothetical protein
MLAVSWAMLSGVVGVSLMNIFTDDEISAFYHCPCSGVKVYKIYVVLAIRAKTTPTDYCLGMVWQGNPMVFGMIVCQGTCRSAAWP